MDEKPKSVNLIDQLDKIKLEKFPMIIITLPGTLRDYIINDPQFKLFKFVKETDEDIYIDNVTSALDEASSGCAIIECNYNHLDSVITIAKIREISFNYAYPVFDMNDNDNYQGFKKWWFGISPKEVGLELLKNHFDELLFRVGETLLPEDVYMKLTKEGKDVFPKVIPIQFEKETLEDKEKIKKQMIEFFQELIFFHQNYRLYHSAKPIADIISNNLKDFID